MLTPGAGKLVGHLDGDVEVLGFGLRETVHTGDVVGYAEVLGNYTSVAWVRLVYGIDRMNRDEMKDIVLTGFVEIACVRTSSISVDLVDCYSHFRAGLDHSDSISSECILGVLSDVDVSAEFGASTFVDDVGCDLRVADDGCVLLTWTDSGAVPCNSIVHYLGLDTS
jgi:hypothetical protein